MRMMSKSNFIIMMSCRNQMLTLTVLFFISVDNSVTKGVTENVENETVSILPMTENQLENLAGDVCFILQGIFTMVEDDGFIEFENCTKTFLSPERDITSKPSKMNVSCRSKTEAKFSITPSRQLQLVVLVPNDEALFIDYYIVKRKQGTGQVCIGEDASNNYTFWTTILNKDGSPSLWRRGPQLPPWSEEKLNITVAGPMLTYNESLPLSKMVDAAFELSFSGEINNCSELKVSNKCEKKDLNDFHTINIKPTTNQTIKIEGIPVNDRCNLSITNNDIIVYTETYNTTLFLQSNSNDTIHNRLDNTVIKEPIEIFFRPEEPKNVTLYEEAIGTSWNIHIGWRRPKRDPEVYNLTLRAPGVFRTKIKDGFLALHQQNATGHVFEDVTGEPRANYNVSIQAISNRSSSPLAVPRGRFPERNSYSTIIITGSWSLILSLVAVFLGFTVWWKRRKSQAFKHFYFPDTDFKPPKEFDITFPEPAVEDSWELGSERLLLHEVIGEGEFGVVRRGTLAPGGKDVAVKMLKDYPTHEEIRSFRAEMELMKSVGSHPHIVNLVGCCSGRKPLIVAEYCSRGDLLSFLRCSWDVMVSKTNAKYYNNNLEASDYRNDLFKKVQIDKFTPLVVNKMYDLQGICDTELTPLDLLSFCRQIAMGMEFLASNRVVHRDLAARNILVTADRTLKITDFGLSRDVYQENHYKQKGNGKLPVKWMALESLTRGIYTSQSDVWSFGIVVWEIVTVGAPPYPEVPAARLPRLLRAGYRMPRPHNCSPQLYDLMLSCWQARSRDRPTFADLHRKLDELLNSACADKYLSLELDYETPPTPKPQRYLKMLLRGNRVWARGESYERPLKSKHYSSPSNYYTSAPAATLAKIQVI